MSNGTNCPSGYIRSFVLGQVLGFSISLSKRNSYYSLKSAFYMCTQGILITHPRPFRCGHSKLRNFMNEHLGHSINTRETVVLILWLYNKRETSTEFLMASEISLLLF